LIFQLCDQHKTSEAVLYQRAMHRYDLDLIREKLELENEPNLKYNGGNSSSTGGINEGSSNTNSRMLYNESGHRGTNNNLGPSSLNHRKSVDNSGGSGPYSHPDSASKFRYKDMNASGSYNSSKDIETLVNNVHGNCGQLLYLLSELRPIHQQAVGLSQTVSQFDKLIQASRDRESLYMKQIEDQNNHLEKLGEELRSLGGIIPELRHNLAEARKDHQNELEGYQKASEKWKKQEIKYQNEVQSLNLQLRQMEDRNLNLKTDYISNKGGSRDTELYEICATKDREIEKLRGEKEEYVQYSKYLLSLVDKGDQPGDVSFG